MSVSKLRIVVSGLIAQYPLGGVTWDYIQYVLGLHKLGHDVYYVEDTGQWPYNPTENGLSYNFAYNLDYLRSAMQRFGLGDRWALRFSWRDDWFGMPDREREEVFRTADLLVDVSGSLGRLDDFRAIPKIAYLDSDPVFTQIKLARGQQDFRRRVDEYDVHLSFGEALSDLVPATGHRWIPTRQPVVIDEWTTSDEPNDAFTTIMNWTSYNAVEFEGRKFGQKDEEFRRFLDLPKLVDPVVLEVALNAGKNGKAPVDLLRHRGWRLVDPGVRGVDADSYRSYIRGSKAEWSVAKNAYVLGRPGWFSCRSACYLAAGRPVVVQDTGFETVLPVGEGILSFRTVAEAAEAIHAVEDDYTRHSRAAAEIARSHFDSGAVLTKLLADVHATETTPAIEPAL